MNKKCTNPACRRVFSTIGSRTECPHCGKAYRISAWQGDTCRRDVVRPVDSGRWACCPSGGYQRLWLAPAKNGGHLPDRGCCTVVLRIDRLPMDRRRLYRVRTLRGDDRFLHLLDAKNVLKAMEARGTVLHTDRKTALAIVTSGDFPVRSVTRMR